MKLSILRPAQDINNSLNLSESDMKCLLTAELGKITTNGGGVCITPLKPLMSYPRFAGHIMGNVKKKT